MATEDPLAGPAFSKVLVSFVIGIALGVAMAAPAVPREVTVLASGDPGPVGSVIIAGVLSVVVVTVGLFGVYQFFWMIDR